jgi:hypothetical protein
MGLSHLQIAVLIEDIFRNERANWEKTESEMPGQQEWRYGRKQSRTFFFGLDSLSCSRVQDHSKNEQSAVVIKSAQFQGYFKFRYLSIKIRSLSRFVAVT